MNSGCTCDWNGEAAIPHRPYCGILVDWDCCADCGLPVYYRAGAVVDAYIDGPHGNYQLDTDVEHECLHGESK